MTVTFTNVTIIIDADSPHDAYSKFCTLMESGGNDFDYRTEDAQYEVAPVVNGEEIAGDVSSLWPDLDGEEGQKFLERTFEFAFCDECGGDAEHHTAVMFLGNWFARCNYPDIDGKQNPVITAYRAQHDGTGEGR